MSKTVNKEINAGVHTNIGMAFQKHCALYLFLEKYPSLKDIRYFIILEHYDDIVFGYLDDKEIVDRIETYQSKKSSTEWKVSQLYEIVKKIIGNALALKADSIEKTKTYSQSHYFATNQSISLKIKKKKLEYGQLVNEANSEVKYSILDKLVQDKIVTKLKKYFHCTDNEIDELQNISFKYIDLSRNSVSQKQQLVGMFQTIFNDSVIDHKAALDTLFYYFQNVETTLNQGNLAKLSDLSKRIESHKIREVINILTTKKKAFDVWRKKTDEISTSLQIPVLDQINFKLHFENSFDKFKDLREFEHQKIFRYVLGKKTDFNNYYKDEDCIGHLFSSFKSNCRTQLTEIQIKAAIYAAYFETKEVS